jgi:hypothetical protein
VAPVDPVDPVYPVDPVAPDAPVGPAGPGTGTGTVTTAGGTTTALSQALNASTVSIAENSIEYFMRIPLDCVTTAAHIRMDLRDAKLQFHDKPVSGTVPFVGTHSCIPAIAAAIRSTIEI